MPVFCDPFVAVTIAAFLLMAGFFIGRRAHHPPTVQVFMKQDARGRFRGSIAGSDGKVSLITCRNYRSEGQLLADLSSDLRGVNVLSGNEETPEDD